MRIFFLTIIFALSVGNAFADCEAWRMNALHNEGDSKSPLKLAVGYATPGSCDKWDVRLAYRHVNVAEQRGLNVTGELIKYFKLNPESTAVAYLLASTLRDRFSMPFFNFDPSIEPNPMKAALKVAVLNSGKVITDPRGFKTLDVPENQTKAQVLELVTSASPKDYLTVRKAVLGLVSYCAEYGYTPAMYDLSQYYNSIDSDEARSKSLYWLTNAASRGHRSAVISLGALQNDKRIGCAYFTAAGAEDACDPQLGEIPKNKEVIEFQRALNSPDAYLERPSPYSTRDFKWWY